MLSSNLGLQALVKQLALTSKSVHWMLHKQAPAFKTLPDSIQTILEQMIQVSNFSKAGTLNFHVFKRLCNDMDSDHLMFLYHTQTLSLSKENVTRTFFKLREEVKAFCQLQNKTEYCFWLDGKEWMFSLA